MSRPLVVLAAIVAVGAILRFWQLRAGVPYSLGVDEPQIMDRAVRMMKTADFNPHFFDWPSLTIYLQFVVACLSFMWGAMHGTWNNLDQVSAANFYVTGRALTAAMGSGTVLLTFCAARRWGTVTGLLAAALMALMPYHVRESHYVLADVPTAFFTTLAWLLSMRALERPTFSAFAWAGVSAGLAASCKYNGSIALLMPLLAAIITGGTPGRIVQRLVTIVAAAGAAFLVGTPYALLDLPSFLNDYARLAAIFARSRGGEPGWSIYLKHLRGSMGTPGLVLAALGIVIAATRVALGPARARWAVLLVFPLVYFDVMATSFQIYGRYTLPLLPFTCAFAAIAIVTLATALWAMPIPRAVALATAAALILGTAMTPAATSISFDRNLGRITTVDQAYRWIRGNVDRGTRVVIETRVLLIPPERNPSENLRALVERDYQYYVDQKVDYLVASTDGYDALFTNPAAPAPGFDNYRSLLVHTTELASFTRTGTVDGPTLRILKLNR
ncbi:MAG: phospholipid carrier-dependent glycosyltransferase [Acidobacteriota bacterium]